MKKYISIFVACLLLLIPSVSFAYVDFDPDPSAPEGISPMVEAILDALLWIGYAIALGMLIYIGIKYTMSAANERADLKKASVNYVIGAIVIAGAVTICNWVVTFFQEAKGDSGGISIPIGGTDTSSDTTGGSTGGSEPDWR